MSFLFLSFLFSLPHLPPPTRWTRHAAATVPSFAVGSLSLTWLLRSMQCNLWASGFAASNTSSLSRSTLTVAVEVPIVLPPAWVWPLEDCLTTLAQPFERSTDVWYRTVVQAYDSPL